MEKSKNKKPKEQSEEITNEAVQTSISPAKNKVNEIIREEEDSFGKFKTKEALIEAYNKLEAEFTKRCQLIKELEKEVQAFKENERLKISPVPLYKRDNWREELEKFRTEFPIAERFGKEIGYIITNDAELAVSPNCLERALLNVLIDNFATVDEIIGSDDFYEVYIAGNDDIKNKIINGYLEKLESERMPATIGAGGETPLSPAKKPKNLFEAGVLAKKLFNNRRI